MLSEQEIIDLFREYDTLLFMFRRTEELMGQKLCHHMNSVSTTISAAIHQDGENETRTMAIREYNKLRSSGNGW